MWRTDAAQAGRGNQKMCVCHKGTTKGKIKAFCRTGHTGGANGAAPATVQTGPEVLQPTRTVEFRGSNLEKKRNVIRFVKNQSGVNRGWGAHKVRHGSAKKRKGAPYKGVAKSGKKSNRNKSCRLHIGRSKLSAVVELQSGSVARRGNS